MFVGEILKQRTKRAVNFVSLVKRTTFNLIRFVFAALIICGGEMIFAQETTDEKSKPEQIGRKYKHLPYDEDWSFLKDQRKRRDYADRFKYILLGKDNWYLTIGGEARPFYEYFRNEIWGAEPHDDNGWVLQRYMLHTDFHLGRKFRAFAQIKSGLINNRVGGARPPDLDKLDLHQLFFDYNFWGGKDKSLMLRAGRQEISFGTSRLVGTREGPNVRQSFDGVRVSSKFRKWLFDAFLVKPVSTEKGIFDNNGQKQQTFGGVYAISPNGFLTRNGKIDLYFFTLDRKSARFNQGTAREIRQSVGTRIWNNVDALDYNFEFVYQFGKFSAGRINAWTAASDTGYTIKKWLFKPRFGLNANRTSGDKDPQDNNLQTFNALYPRGAYFGISSPIGPYNHTDLHGSVLLNIRRNFAINLDWINYWRTSRRDAVYSVAGTILKSGDRSRALFIGREFTVEGSYKFDSHLTLTANISRFQVGKFLRESPPAENTNYYAAWLTYKF